MREQRTGVVVEMLRLQNSYIFLKNPYKKDEKKYAKNMDGVITLDVGRSVYAYVVKSFSIISKVDNYGSVYKKKYICRVQSGRKLCDVEFIITEVVGITYLDISAVGQSTLQVIKCLEHIQETLMNSGIREDYIDIISYDAISEYYCNKIYGHFNTLERNLRKLLFNIYILNFEQNYYKETINVEIQNKIKGLINSNISKEIKIAIKNSYNASNSEAENIIRMQQFFYSLEFGDIQKMLFEKSWTQVDETEMEKYLEEHKNLSVLLDEELREAFRQFSPKSDWERFFSSKIDVSDVETIIQQVRQYRNVIAHFKFFYQEDYEACSKLIKSFNTVIVNAIQITEDVDFAKKNAEALKKAFSGLVYKIEDITKTVDAVSIGSLQKNALQRLKFYFDAMHNRGAK